MQSSFRSDIKKKHQEKAQEQYRADIHSKLDSLYKDVLSYGEKKFFDDFNNIGKIQTQMEEFVYRITIIKKQLSIRPDFFSSQIFLQLSEASRLLKSSENHLRDLSQKCSEEILLPAANAIWNAKNLVELELNKKQIVSDVTAIDLIDCLTQECDFILNKASGFRKIASRLKHIRAGLTLAKEINHQPSFIKNVIKTASAEIHNCHDELLQSLNLDKQKLILHKSAFASIKSKGDITRYLQALNSIYPVTLDCLSAEIMETIVEKIPDHKSFLNFRLTANLNKNFVDNHFSTLPKFPKFYYAVVAAVPLYEKADFTDFLGHFRSFDKERENIPRTELLKTIEGEKILHIFDNLKDATQYSKYHSWCTYNSNRDTFDLSEKTPIFVISLNTPYACKKATGTMSDRWVLHSPFPPPVKTLAIPGYVSKTTNIEKIVFGKLYNNDHPFFVTQKESEKLFNEFRLIWDHTLDSQYELGLTVRAKCALVELFRSYSAAFLSSLTRNHHERVNEILQDILAFKTLSDIAKYLDGKLRDAKIIPGINTKGHYYMMLQFALREIRELTNLEEFFLLL